MVLTHVRAAERFKPEIEAQPPVNSSQKWTVSRSRRGGRVVEALVNGKAPGNNYAELGKMTKDKGNEPGIRSRGLGDRQIGEFRLALSKFGPRSVSVES